MKWLRMCRIYPATLLRVAVVITCLYMASCTHPARRYIFQPHKIKDIPRFPPDIVKLETFWLETPQGKVEVWILPGKDLSSASPGPGVMIAHGNRELIDYYVRHAIVYSQMGITVMMGEYRGYGRSQGTPTQEHITSDHITLYDILSARPEVDPDRIIFHGRSLGGGVLCALAGHRKAAAIILESTFTSIKDMALGAPDFLLPDKFDNIFELSLYNGPVLIIHGIKDDVVPVSHAVKLHQHAKNSKLILYDSGHSDGPPDWSRYWEDIQNFLTVNNIVRNQ